MESKIIKRYRKKSVAQLRGIATVYFNRFIRLRDRNLPCISCNNDFNQAGHYYSGGHYSALKFNEDNVNGQCIRCNYHLHGNLIEYRLRLEKKIGLDRIKKLDEVAKIYKRTSFKWDKMTLIEIIETYKLKCKSSD